MTRVFWALWTWSRDQYVFSRISYYPSWKSACAGDLRHDYLESSGEPRIVPISQKRTRGKETVTCPMQGIHPCPVHHIMLVLWVFMAFKSKVSGFQSWGVKRREESYLSGSCVTEAYPSGPRKHLQAQLFLSCPLLRCIIGSDSPPLHTPNWSC